MDETKHTGLFSLTMMLQYLQQPVDIASLQHEYCPEGRDFTPLAMVRAAKSLGLRAREVNIKPKRLDKTPMPFIGIDKQGEFFIIAALHDDQILIQRAGQAPDATSRERLRETWEGRAILITSRSLLPGTLNKFDLSWFVPVVVKYRKLFRDVLIASFFIQLFALITPLIFQVIMDKVLVHKAVMTLNVLVIALLSITLFEIILGGLRTYVFSHTTSRVDVELGSELFRHLLLLPIAFFNSRPVGQVVARVRELDNIRNFLTGSALTLVIDLVFSLLFIAVMFFYSERLAWIVVGSIPFYVLISILITPGLRKRTEEQFQRGAINHSFLTESMTGIETLKSMAVEPQMRKRWEDQLAAYARASYNSGLMGMFGSQSVQLVSKTVTALLMWQGALEVINGRLSVGELIAFNMLAGQVAGPILRLAQLWQDFQQFRISMDRLGDIINAPVEHQSNSNLPAPVGLEGEVNMDQVIFRYGPGAPEVLNKFSLMVPAGQVLGIAGRSGSGKSTLTKLIQRLYIPESGKVFLDGQNIALMNPAWVRRQIGVVLQDSILFNSSIRDNIALSNPAMGMKEVIYAAELAGAHDFISALPQGYQTILGERGSGLSGGQLQRLAIARALVSQPKILIFDEATSALDYESEKAIQDNMQTICANRTVIIVAHRLSTICHCDRIIVVDKGTVIEDGSHAQLLKLKGTYAGLWASQTSEGPGHD